MRTLLLLALAMALTGCGRKSERTGQPTAGSEDAGKTLLEARKGFQTKLERRPASQDPLDEPPPNLFRIVSYDSPVGKLAAYLTPDAGDGKKRPAIVWITGGDCNSIGDVWSLASAENDQTAAQYREAGLVMMFPSLRGGNENPGKREGFFGEVDDVLAATAYLAKQPHVDAKRIYLGGHSTGGTLVLLVAAAAPADLFRAVFSFGPVDDVAGYGPRNEYCPFDMSNFRELDLRAPGRWLHTIKTPTFVIEGNRQGNVRALLDMKKESTNPLVQFFPVKGADHFSILAPVNRVLAAKIKANANPLTLDDGEIANAMGGR